MGNTSNSGAQMAEFAATNFDALVRDMTAQKLAKDMGMQGIGGIKFTGGEQTAALTNEDMARNTGGKGIGG